MMPCYAIVHSDLRVTGCPGETGWAGGADHDPLDGAGDGLHGVGGEAAQEVGSAVLVLAHSAGALASQQLSDGAGQHEASCSTLSSALVILDRLTKGKPFKGRFQKIIEQVSTFQ